jgi:glycosyltransferase involved in cell wall biosynthesis
MVSSNLSIVIITYNRAEKLNSLLCAISRSVLRACALVVLDNYSTDNTVEICNRWETELPHMQRVTHSLNIGGNGNILRAYEYGSGYYKWILCDDDHLNVDAAEELQEVVQRREYDLVRVSDVGVQTSERGKASTLEELLHRPRSGAFWSLGFVPGVVFRSDMVRDSVRVGYSYVHTSYQQLFILMGAFALSTRTYTTKKPVISRGEGYGGTGCEIYAYWFRSLSALPTKRARQVGLSCILNRHNLLGFPRMIVGDILYSRPSAVVRKHWKNVLLSAPSLWSFLLVLLCFPLPFVPRRTIKRLYPLLLRKEFVDSDVERVRQERS